MINTHSIVKRRLYIAAVYIQAALYLLAGFNHFRKPDMYMRIMPRWLPQPLSLVYISGAIEMVLALLLLFARTRKWAAYGIVLLLIAVFPANV